MCKLFLRIALVGVLTILNVTGQAQERKTVLERLAEVRENHNVRFVYDSALNWILDKEYDGASIKGMELDKALDSLLKDTGVTWSRQKDYINVSLMKFN